MKSYRLSETDLANLAFRGPALKRAWLDVWLKPKIVPYTYNPFRSTVGDAVNLHLPLFPDGQVATPWRLLEESVRRACGNNDAAISVNLPIARAVHAFAEEKGLTAEPFSSLPLTLFPGRSYTYWMSLLLRYEDGVSVAFADPRRAHALNNVGRRFVLSAMHERLRASDPDNAELRVEVWQFDKSNSRKVKVYRAEEADLISYEEIIADVAETYSVLAELLEEQETKTRRAAGGMRGPLL